MALKFLSPGPRNDVTDHLDATLPLPYGTSGKKVNAQARMA